MTGFSRARRASDFDMMQVLPAVVLVAVMLIGGDWVGDTTEEADAQRARQGRALTIAMQQASAAMSVEFDRLGLTSQFVPMLLADSPGTHAADPTTPSDPDVAAQPEYAVEMRITALDDRSSIRKVEVRVGYEASDGDRVWVETATVRQHRDTLQAKTARNARPTHG